MIGQSNSHDQWTLGNVTKYLGLNQSRLLSGLEFPTKFQPVSSDIRLYVQFITDCLSNGIW